MPIETTIATRLDTVIVRQSHTIDDLLCDLAAYKRMVSDLRWLLRTGLDACDGGNQPITREYLDRALTALDKVRTSEPQRGQCEGCGIDGLILNADGWCHACWEDPA